MSYFAILILCHVGPWKHTQIEVNKIKVPEVINGEFTISVRKNTLTLKQSECVLSYKKVNVEID